MLAVPTTRDHVGSLCMGVIALFGIEKMQWIPLGHVDHRMLGILSEMSRMSEMCPGCQVSVNFKLDLLDMAERDTVRSCPVMSGNMSGCVR